MTSLPRHVPVALQEKAFYVSAYNICLRLEQSLQEDLDNGKDVGRDLIYVRILGYLIHYAPTSHGIVKVAEEISSCQCIDSPGDRRRALLDVGKMYYDYFLRAFRANKGRTPTPPSHVSRPSFNRLADMVKATLVEVPTNYSQAKQNALIRDNYRCVATGRYDSGLFSMTHELRDIFAADPGRPGIATTHCAHIFSEFTQSSIEKDSVSLDHAASMWAVMDRFGYKGLPAQLNGPNVHRLENVMTLDPSFHGFFDQLKVWFAKTNEENKYKLEAQLDEYLTGLGCAEYVKFTTPDPVKLPVPSPVYLAIHAACAKVAHLSGAAECIDKYYRDMDDSETLNPTGASAEMLEHALFELEVSGYAATV